MIHLAIEIDGLRKKQNKIRKEIDKVMKELVVKELLEQGPVKYPLQPAWVVNGVKHGFRELCRLGFCTEADVVVGFRTQWHIHSFTFRASQGPSERLKALQTFMMSLDGVAPPKVLKHDLERLAIWIKEPLKFA